MWFKMTAPNGDPVWINASSCSCVQQAVTADKRANAEIHGSFGYQAVTETVEEVMKVIRKW